MKVREENFFASFKVLVQEGYLKVANFSFKKENTAPKEDKENENESADEKCDAELTNLLMHLKKGDSLTADTYEIKEGETSPPKRYTSGSIILTMENAGQFIEDEELRDQGKRHRHQRHESGDPEETGEYRISGTEQEDPGADSHPDGRDDL